MFALGPVGFAAPLLLLALVALPILWWLLRAVPPAPIRRRFPGIALLLGLQDDETQTDTTPWWLLLLRMLAVAAFIIGFAGPILNPEAREPGTGPLLVVFDGSWASAPNWPARVQHAETLIASAGRDGRAVATLVLTDPPSGEVAFQSADVALRGLAGLTPEPWEPSPASTAEVLNLLSDQSFETIWFSDGLERETRTDMLETLEASGSVTVIEGDLPVFAIKPPVFEDGVITVSGIRQTTELPRSVIVNVIGPDPNGNEQELSEATLTFDSGEAETNTQISLPTELVNRVRRFELDGIRSAGAVTLTDDALKRRQIGLISSITEQEQQDLLSPLHYLRKALVPTADLIDGTLSEMILASPDVIVLADVATLAEAERDSLVDWVDEGGLLVRFAGLRTAGADFSDADPLMPVRLRAGGRSVGGAMSWGEPKKLRAFTPDSPFFGLRIPSDIEVTSQVVAQPDPDLAERTIATLADGTPLVTQNDLGNGRVILFHVTANAEWSTLPLSGLFVQMLERLAISTRPAQLNAEELAGTTWVPEEVLDGFGDIDTAPGLPGVSGEELAERKLSAEMPPGLYAGGERQVALNVIDTDRTLAPVAWPQSVKLATMEAAEETDLKGPLLALALILLAADILASLWLSGRLTGQRASTAILFCLALALPLSPAEAQTEDTRALEATSEVVLAYVLTGDASLDEVSRAGLDGLSQSLFRRTSVEPAQPIAVDLETDELSFYPLLYWPITESQPRPSSEAYAKLNRYLRTGGMIVFDTRDANLGGFGSATPAAKKLRQLAAPLDIPALEPVPVDHVLTRTFYLLQDFPGRHASRDVWVEAAPVDAEQIEGMPFRDLNDGVTPVLIGGNDWASAWARDANGRPMFPVGRGFAGERQREFAIRFGVNLVMHVLTGNYKSDQVHVPALLDRLGN